MAFNISAALETLYEALPDDTIGAPVPTRSVVGMLQRMAESLASELAERGI